MRLIFLSVLLFGAATASAQQCNCEAEFNWVKSFMEKNHPGFNSDIKTPDDLRYKAFTNDLLRKIKNNKTGIHCLIYLKKYIRYLKDHHSNINGAFVPLDESNPDSLRAFLNSALYKGREIINTDSNKLVKYFSALNPNSVEGIYITADTTYTVAVIKSKTANRDYAAVILASKTPVWKKGQVKFELKDRSDGYREGFFYMRNYSLNYEEWLTGPGETTIVNWRKIFPGTTASARQVISGDLVSFRVLDSSTSYISIRSFGSQFNIQLDSAYKKIIPELKKYPNLVIDVRNNGGGSDINYTAFMPLLYTDTIYNDFVELFVTDDNKKAYEKNRDEAKNNPQRYGANGYISWEYRLNQMKNVPANTFVPISAKNSTSVYKPVEGFPKKVAILYNRFCASSCEQFLLDAMFSKKVKLVGENSGGFLAYGNVMEIKTPCGNSLNWTTTRKNKDRKYEFVGVTPQVKIGNAEKDWIEYTRKLLAQ
ncbi:MAG: S41 family peptidase [Chitinophagaceae bacterium]|nr:S41 family peptidase [Chitinophagaceae bacterium]